MPVEVDVGTIICAKCGLSYGRRKGNFPASYAILHKGLGYIPVCRNCIDGMYDQYLKECKNPADAVRQMCRKLDIYWNEPQFHSVEKKASSRSMMTSYLQRMTTINLIGKCYDDTLREEGMMWTFKKPPKERKKSKPATDESTAAPNEQVQDETAEITPDEPEEEEIVIPDEVMKFWGPGYTPSMYRDLEERLQYWKSQLPDGIVVDIGTDALLRQICCLEIDINRDRAHGRSVDKNVSLLNTLLGSAMLKPAQKKDDAADAALESTPLGVWLYRYENKRPLPEIDDDLKDVNGILRYVFIWLGHVCKMLGKKNGFSRLYEKEIAKYRVDRPEFDDEDDEEFLSDVLDEDDGLDEELNGGEI